VGGFAVDAFVGTVYGGVASNKARFSFCVAKVFVIFQPIVDYGNGDSP